MVASVNVGIPDSSSSLISIDISRMVDHLCKPCLTSEAKLQVYLVQKVMGKK
jgi:hypothetical protein